MKKIISLVLAAIMLICCTSVFAESPLSFTPADVLEWLAAGDQNAADVDEQAANASYNLGLALAYVTSLNANEDQLASLQDILNALVEVRDNEELSASQKQGVNCAYIVRLLTLLCKESDVEGVHAERLQGYIDSYNEADESIDSSEGQTVNALFTSVKLATLLVEECCTSQELIDQLQSGVSEMSAENEAAENASEQMVIGAKWLRKMLGAFAKLNNSNCISMIEQEWNLRESLIVENELNANQTLVQYLASSVYAMAIFTGFYTVE
ncbi:MAG: hypothetical protein IJ246_09185 [Clostridia bacterium]|nr:hypothetical protein [Clostridia bacterium]